MWGRGEYGRLGLGDRSGSSKLRATPVAFREPDTRVVQARSLLPKAALPIHRSLVMSMTQFVQPRTVEYKDLFITLGVALLDVYELELSLECVCYSVLADASAECTPTAREGDAYHHVG